MFTVDNALNVLRVDGEYNTELVQSLVDALLDYIEIATGMSADQQETEPLVDTVSGFLVTLWYYGDHSDTDKLQRVIDSLLKSITMKVNKSDT